MFRLAETTAGTDLLMTEAVTDDSNVGGDEDVDDDEIAGAAAETGHLMTEAIF